MAKIDEVAEEVHPADRGADAPPSDADESDGEHPGESEVEREMRKEIVCRERMQKAKEKYGPSHERVVFWALKLVDYLIPQYKLNETEAILDEIMPYCKELGGTSYIKAVQSKAFNLFKQYKFKECLACFHEQETLVGPSALLYENLAHAYNSTGDYDQAARYFTLANSLIESGAFGKRGGILLGLGLVKERQGKPAEALPILQEALAHYKKEVRLSVFAPFAVERGCFRPQPIHDQFTMRSQSPSIPSPSSPPPPSTITRAISTTFPAVSPPPRRPAALIVAGRLRRRRLHHR